MRELNITLREALNQGLKPEPRTPSNTPFLEKCKNLIPTESGAHTPPVLNIIEQPSIWPFPKLVNARHYTLLLGRTTLSTADLHSQTSAEVPVYNYYFLDDEDEIQPGGVWHFVDFWSTWMAFNGECTLISTPWVPDVLVQRNVKINAACNLMNGRAVFGGFKNDSLNAYHNTIRAHQCAGDACVQALVTGATNVGENWVWWSSIGGDDLFSLFDVPQKGVEPYYATWLRGESGFAPMPWPGAVLAVRALGEAAIVYGENGVSALVPGDPRGEPAMGVYPVTGLGNGVGIGGRGCVAGDDRVHVFLSTDAELWYISPRLEAERMGYSHVFGDYDLKKTVISLDAQRRHFWISDGNTCHVLTRNGLGGPMDIQPTSVVRSGGELYGVAEPHENQSVPVEIQTVNHDFIERGTKHISTVQIQQRGLKSVKVMLEGNHGSTPWVAANHQDVAFPRLSFSDAKVSVRGLAPHDKGDIGVERVEIRYNAEDLRYRRGTKGVFQQRQSEDGDDEQG